MSPKSRREGGNNSQRAPPQRTCCRLLASVSMLANVRQQTQVHARFPALSISLKTRRNGTGPVQKVLESPTLESLLASLSRPWTPRREFLNNGTHGTHGEDCTRTQTQAHTSTHAYLKAGSSLPHRGGGEENAFLLLKSFWKRVGGILYQNAVGTEGLLFQIHGRILILVTVSMGVTVI